MLQLSRLRTALCLRADARHDSHHPSLRRPHPRKASTKTSLGLGVALGTLCASWIGVAAAQEQKPSPVVATKEGPVQGVVSNGVTKFLGIPYAEPPVGNLRWRPPQDRAA